MEDDTKKKSHRPSKAKERKGENLKKKKGGRGRKEKDESIDPKIRNPKAFAFNSAVRAERKFRRTQDIETKKERVPLVDRTPVDLPPFIIALVGPPKVGKSTLFQNLIKNFTRQTLTDVKGPVTVISGKKRRLTLIECNNDINSMIDTAKVADLVLLLIDASFGFEMEIFEFLNICQVHGFPQIMGVLTHLDLFKNKNHLKKTKKTLKHRFWTEVYPGSKLFYLSGYHPMTNSYPKNEIHNLARFISIMKFRPTLWRTEHAYVVADRMEDMTPPESIQLNQKVDRTVCLYGFVHGTFLKPHISVHIPGLGDYTPQAVTGIDDPCPLPMKERNLRRSLNEKERMIYAPFSGVGGIVYDQDAVYIDLGGSHSHNSRRNQVDENKPEPVAPFISELRDLKSTLHEKMDSAVLRLFSTSDECFTSADLESQNLDDETEENKSQNADDEETDKNRIKNVKLVRAEDGRMRRKVLFKRGNSDSDEITEALQSELNDLKSNSKSSLTESQIKRSFTMESSDEDDNIHEDGKSSASEVGSGNESGIDEKERTNSTLSTSSKKANSQRMVNDNVADLVAKVKARLSKDVVKEENIPAPNKEAAISEDDQQMSEDDEADVDQSDEDDNNKADHYVNSISSTDEDSEAESEDQDVDSENSDEHEENDEDENGEDLIVSKKRRYDEAEHAFYSRFKTRSLQKLIYEDTGDYRNLNSRADFDLANCTIQETQDDNQEDLNDERMKNFFVGGDYAESAKHLLDEDDKDVFGDFEELDGGNEKEGDDSQELDEDSIVDSNEAPEIKMQNKREVMKKKLKEKFDMDYDEGNGDKNFYKDWKSQVEEQTKVNRTFFTNIDDPSLLKDLQGYAPGSYVRIEIGQLPYEFVVNFDAQRTSPLVIGSLDTPNQETMAVVQARVKKHRWHPKILKTRDPIILSVGWRRFQTISLYSVHDHNLRNRMVKYTPEHLHCIANFYGPITSQGTGVLGIAPQGFDGFRITLTGTILDMDKSTQLVKKLKLIGTPAKIFKKSAFIDGMFNSQLEVTKFTGARIKSVSGVRGVIKRALRTPEGSFRATFEDKILASDIVFCRTWANVDVPKFFLNLPTHVIEQPRLVKTMGQLKREKQIQATPNPDNAYTPIVREVKKFRPLKIPKNLQQRLPYKDKPKIQAKLNEQKRIAVIKEPHERNMTQMLKVMKARMGEKERNQKLEKTKKAAEREKVMKRLEEKQTYRQKELRKKVFRTLGLMNKTKPDATNENFSSGRGGRGGGKFTKRRRP